MPLGGGMSDGGIYFVNGNSQPEKDGCKLTGWSVSKTASMPEVNAYLDFLQLKKLSTNKLYAYWSPVHTITLSGTV